MKFTEEQAVEALRSKMTENGEKLQLSERTLKSMVSKYFKKFADEDTELEDFINDNIEDFKVVDGQIRKDNSDFIKNYKPNTNPKQNDNGKKDSEGNNSNSDCVASLAEELRSLRQELEAQKAEKAINKIKNDLQKAISNKGVKDNDWINSMLDIISVNPDTDIELESTRLTEVYNKQMAQYAPNVTPNHSGCGGDDEINVDDIIQELKMINGES